MMIADLRPLAGTLRGSLADQGADAPDAASSLPARDLLDCLRALGGWVAPDGLAPRADFDRLVEQGLLEAWPGRPLYRVRPQAGDDGLAR